MRNSPSFYKKKQTQEEVDENSEIFCDPRSAAPPSSLDEKRLEK